MQSSSTDEEHVAWSVGFTRSTRHSILCTERREECDFLSRDSNPERLDPMSFVLLNHVCVCVGGGGGGRACMRARVSLKRVNQTETECVNISKKILISALIHVPQGNCIGMILL